VSGKTIVLSPGQSITIDLGKLTAPVRIEVEPGIFLRGRWVTPQPEGTQVRIDLNGETQIVTPHGSYRDHTTLPGEKGIETIYPGGKGIIMMWAATATRS
jgi:hypothetical protein